MIWKVRKSILYLYAAQLLYMGGKAVIARIGVHTDYLGIGIAVCDPLCLFFSLFQSLLWKGLRLGQQ